MADFALDGTHYTRARGLTRYQIPASSDVKAFWGSSVLIQGRVGGDTLVTSPWQYESLFSPGPWPESVEDVTQERCDRFDRVWSVSRRQIEHDEDVEWPIELGASVLEGDGNPDSFDPRYDVPAALGDHMLWWVMHDQGAEERRGHNPTRPLGIEVRVSAWAFDRADVLDKQTFLKYQVTYRGTRRANQVYLGFFVDGESGDTYEDYSGTDTTRQMVYFYSMVDRDRAYPNVPPPATGAMLIQGPTGDDGQEIGLTASWHPLDDSCCWPWRTVEHFRYARGFHTSGPPLVEGGLGRGAGIPGERRSMHQYPGDPVAGSYWSNENMDGAGERFGGGHREAFMYFGPFTMDPGDEQEMIVALLWAQGADRLDSVVKLREVADIVRENRDFITSPTVSARPSPDIPDNARLALSGNRPNPFSARTRIEFELPVPATLELHVFDLLGRHVTTLADGPYDAGQHSAEFAAAGLTPGVYYYRFRIGGSVFTRPMILVR
ncbi:MAG: T9SS type A sorting domain-containing protein [Rhodothermales bacterium]|nr:T9SS type A sorting domain-containing protein [Rhodothermales bacterium]MBO6780952.1 T9SS type A sorting domain-containing protein [Rhodothermales bacterium]